MVKPGVYEHYKGKRYRVIGIALMEHTEEPVVVYEALYDNDRSHYWVRSAAEFTEDVIVRGELVPRYKFISEDGT